MWKDASRRREYGRAYMRGLREWRVEHHICAECGEKDAYTLAGRYRCAECTAKHRGGKASEAKQRENERARDLRWQRREEHNCTECGKPLPSAYRFAMCKKCRADDRQYQLKRCRAAGVLPRSMWQEQGLCVRCGKARMGAETKWDGRDIQLCASCYQKTISAAELGRASFFEKYGMTWGNSQYEWEHRIRRKARANP